MDGTVTYKCPNCDAGLIFDADRQRFVCEFCLSDFSEGELGSLSDGEKIKEEARLDEQFCKSVRSFFCQSCGAEVIAEETTAATKCYYCHNPIVIGSKLSGAKRPAKIIPFKFGREEARRTFLDFARSKRFVPRDYFSEENADNITGIYYPFWVVDADTDSNYGTVGRRIRTWVAGDYSFTETSRFAVHRRANIHFEDISIFAIDKEDKKMMEGILPYPSDAHVDFSMPYLQGFLAKSRNIERESLSQEIRGKMESYSEALLKSTVQGYSSYEGGSASVRIRNSHWQYTLMPVWILNYKKNDKNYTYAMNGHTGKIYGELPVSIPKLALLFSSLFVGIGALLSLILWFLL